jgi:hypothetical protein
MDLFGEPFGRMLEIAHQIVKDAQVGARGSSGVVATRDFIERHLPIMGHRTYRRGIPIAHSTSHAKRLP